MSKFYFDFRHGETTCSDPEGTELPTMKQAYLEAIESAREMWGDLLRNGRDPRRCFFEVRDADHNFLFVLPFEDVMATGADKAMARHEVLHRTWDVICAEIARQSAANSALK